MAEYDTRPLSMYHTSDWHLLMNGQAAEAGPSRQHGGRTSLTNSYRRRPSAAAGPPAGSSGCARLGLTEGSCGSPGFPKLEPVII